jgi:hypothetical protein
MVVSIVEKVPVLYQKPVSVVSSDKFKQTFTVEPVIGGYIFYKITPSTGKCPKELSGNYTTMKMALKALTHYELQAKPSKAFTRDKNYEERH